MDTNEENMCVMNFRGGDMIGNAGAYVPRSYWDKAIERMIEYNPKMEFCIVTDDVATCLLYTSPSPRDGLLYQQLPLSLVSRYGLVKH